MTYGEAERPEAGGSDARVAAKERARELRQQHRKQERRRRVIVLVSALVASVAVLAIVAVVLVSGSQATARGPLNMASDGIKIGAGLEAVRTTGVDTGDEPVASAPNEDGVIDIRLYVDYLCANCGTFTQNNDDQLRRWVESGAATLEIHPIALLTSKSAGTQYSLRAANAAACVAEYAPDSFLDFHDSLFSGQPEEGSEGLTDEELLSRAEDAGVVISDRMRSCVEKKRFATWVQDATVRALNGPIPNADIPAVTTAPTVIVDGKLFTYSKEFDPDELAQFVTRAAGDQYTGTPSPTPTPSATPAG